MAKSSVQLSYLKRHWRPYVLQVLKHSIAWLAVLFSFHSSFRAFIPEESPARVIFTSIDSLVLMGWPVLLMLLAIIILAAIRYWPSVRATYYDERTQVQVIVECCDIFDQSGLRVIHSVDTFDTALGEIITRRSLHGAFLQRMRDRGVDVDDMLNHALRRHHPVATNPDLPGRHNCYALGEVCRLETADGDYALVSFSHLQPDGSISLTKHDYVQFLTAMWTNLTKPHIRRSEINVAIMGNHFIDLPSDFTVEQKIDIMLQTFFSVARHHHGCKTLRICVHDSDAMQVDFAHYSTIMEHLAKRPVLEIQ